MATPAIVLRHYADGTDSTKNISIPEYPSSFSSDDNFTSVSFNSINGTFNDRLICYKKKFIWKFDALSEDDINTMYYGATGIIGKIKEHKGRFFTITSNLPGMPSGIYYLGTPSSFSFLGQSGGIRWYSGELHWIEVDGTKLNQPIQGGNS